MGRRNYFESIHINEDAMGTRPWMKFYPSDWIGSSRLRRCSIAARGLAVELMCHMHMGEPYGHLTVKGDTEIARLVGLPHQTVRKLLPMLVATGVVCLSQTGTIFSPRMVRDYEKHLKRQADGGKGGNPALTQVVNHEDKPSDTRYQKPETRKEVHDASRQQEKEKRTHDEVVPLDEAPKAKLFRVGKTTLVSLGISEKQSGAIIGRWLKQKNDPEGILAALEYSAANGIIEPIGYVTRCLTKEAKSEKLSLADQTRRLAERARELENQAGLGRPPIAIGSS
jgi:hypothetical protein